MTFSRVERFMLLGMGYIVLIALAAIVWPKGPATTNSLVTSAPSVSTSVQPSTGPSLASSTTFWHTFLAATKGTVIQTPAQAPVRTYVTVANDTVQIIESKTSFPWADIYKLNATTIENNAKYHGLTSSNNGQYIFPGETLVLPAGH